MSFKIDVPDEKQQSVDRLTRRRALLLAGGAGVAAVAVACTPAVTATSTPAPAAAAPATPPASAAPGSSVAPTVVPPSAPAPATTAPPVATAAASGTPLTTASLACVVTPEQTAGPFFVDGRLNQRDITGGRAGTPLTLTLRVARVAGGGCVPWEGAAVDIWHCDAAGAYSDVATNNTRGQNWLRGYQVTDANGAVTFQTVYPGWYQGRAVHIHFMVRASVSANTSSAFTSQLYFDDALTDQVFRAAPYTSRPNRTTRNAGDGAYRSGGSSLVLDVSQQGQAYTARFDIGVRA